MSRLSNISELKLKATFDFTTQFQVDLHQNSPITVDPIHKLSDEDSTPFDTCSDSEAHPEV